MSVETGGPPLEARILADLRALRQGDGTPVLPELIDLFLSDSSARMAELRAAVSSGGLAQAKVLAHTIKGSGGSLGALPLSKLCGRLEILAGAGGGPEAGPLLERIEAEYARVREALEREKRS